MSSLEAASSATSKNMQSSHDVAGEDDTPMVMNQPNVSAVDQHSALQEHKTPVTEQKDEISESSNREQNVCIEDDAQPQGHQQNSTPVYTTPTTTHTADGSQMMNRGNTQDMSHQQSSTPVYTSAASYKIDRHSANQQKQSQQLSYTRGNTKDMSHQQSSAPVQTTSTTTHIADVNQMMTRGNTQDMSHQQSSAPVYTTPNTTHTTDGSQMMNRGNTQDMSHQQSSTPVHTSVASYKIDQHSANQQKQSQQLSCEQVLSPLEESLVKADINKNKLTAVIIEEGCMVGRGWLSGNKVTVNGTNEMLSSALRKFFCYYEISGDDFYPDMKNDLDSLQKSMPEDVSFLDEKEKYKICCINKVEVKSVVQKKLEQMKCRNVSVPVPIYAYSFFAATQEEFRQLAKKHDPSLDITICDTSLDIELCTKRSSVTSTVDWFHKFVMELKTAEKKVERPNAVYLQSLEAHKQMQSMEINSDCVIDLVVDGEQSVLKATSPDGHQLLVCQGHVAATDCNLIVLPLHAGQTQWSPLERFVLRRSVLSEDLEIYHMFCRDKLLELQCHGDYVGKAVVVIPIPAGGGEKEIQLIIKAYKSVLTSLKDGQHSVALFVKQGGTHLWETNLMEFVLISVFQAFSELGSEPSVSVTVVVYTDSPKTAQNFCYLVQQRLPEGWRLRPKIQRDQIQGSIMERNLSVQEGEIQNVEADVVVNSTNTRLEPTHGAVENAILHAAGKKLNEHLKKLNPEASKDCISVNGLVATDNFQMKNTKRIFHVALHAVPFSDKTKDTLLHGLHLVTQRCLLKASMEKLKSIAFPFLGTGRLNYPISDVQSTMTSAINMFFTEMPQSSLEKVIIVSFAQKKLKHLWSGDYNKPLIERIKPLIESKKECCVTICGQGNVEQVLDEICSLAIPEWYRRMTPEILGLEEESHYPANQTGKGQHGISNKEMDKMQVDALEFLLKDKFNQAFEVKKKNGKFAVTLRQASSQDLLTKVESLREDYVPLSDEEMTRLEDTEDTVDVSQDGIEAFIKIDRDQGRVAIFAFDFYAITSAKHLVKVKVGQVKVTTRAHRQFGSGNTGLGRTERNHSSLHSFDQPKAVDFFTKSDMKIYVYRANITRLSVHAIVNAANGTLVHGGGVACAIAEAAGPDLVKECNDYIKKNGVLKVGAVVVTTGGRLPCSKVLHAVGPRWGDYSDTEKSVCKMHLSDTVFNCLVTAESLGSSTIALPSISSAIFGVPQDICAWSYLDAVLNFDLRGQNKLKQIHFVDVNEDMVVRIQSVFTAECNSPERKIRAGPGHSRTDRGRPSGRQMEKTVSKATGSSV